MAGHTDPEELQNFLKNVDEIENIIKGLASDDKDAVAQSMQKADERLITENKSKTKAFDRTVINRSTSDGTAAPQYPNSQEGFMKMVEKDIEDRSRVRQENLKIATGLKEQGNKAFQEGDLEVALRFYTEALSKAPDQAILYNNRAQTLIKLGRFEEALKDCDWAIRADDKFVKGYVTQGRAQLRLRQFEKARESFQEAIRVEPKSETVVQEYIDELNREEKRLQEEEQAKAHLGESTTMPEILAKFSGSTTQPTMFYTGAIMLLQQLMKNETDRTLFRMQDGIASLFKHPVLQQCLQMKRPDQRQKELLASLWQLMEKVCCTSEANQNEVFAHSKTWLTSSLDRWLKNTDPHCTAFLQFLLSMAAEKFSRTLILTHFPDSFYVNVLRLGLKESSELCLRLLSSLAVEARVKAHLRGEDAIGAFVAALRRQQAATSFGRHLFGLLVELSTDAAVRSALAGHEEFATTIMALLESDHQLWLVELSLTLFINLAVGADSSKWRLDAKKICTSCLRYTNDTALQGAAMNVLASFIWHAADRDKFQPPESLLEKCVTLLQAGDSAEGQKLRRSSMKILTWLCCHEKAFQDLLLQKDPKLLTLCGYVQSNDEITAGNALLCLSRMVDSLTDDAFVDSDLIQQTLTVVRDSRNETVRKNGGIMLGKLARKHPRHLEKLRELHGFEILHSNVKPYEL